MRATTFEFRIRMAINAAIILLGFWSPWIEWLRVGHRISLIEWLAIEVARLGLASFSTATTALIILAMLFAVAAVWFRVWGTAYLGPSTVNSLNMIAGRVMADGPYRYLRNPLYIGVWCMVAAMAFLMPASGALFAMVLITVFMVRLTLGEEAFLSAQLGDPYRAYLRSVPRYIPRLRGAPPPSGANAHWVRALAAELIPVGVLVALMVFSRSYNLSLAGRIILIFFGVSLVVRAFVPRPTVSSEPAN